jgi:ubiquinone/menaquinone biosynthesis C-methylase UbiE
MFLSRTRQKSFNKLKTVIFDLLRLQDVVDLRDKEQLELSMGFRGQFDEHRRFQIELLKAQGLTPSDHLLEIGCGPLTGGIPVIDYLETGNYIGVDIRSAVLDLAYKEIGKAGLSAKNPRLIYSSSFGLSELAGRVFDCIFSFSVLYHLDDKLLSAYFGAVRKFLKPNGICIANVNTVHEGGIWLEFPFLKRSIEQYGELAAAQGLKARCLGEIQDFGFRLAGAERHNQVLSFRLNDGASALRKAPP